MGIAYLAGRLPQGRVGVGPAALRSALARHPAAATPTLTLEDVHTAFDRIAEASGSGSQRERGRILGGLLARAIEDERRFLTRLVLGKLRQGAQEGVLLEAVALASGLPAEDVRRAAMLRGSAAAAGGALLGGGGGLRAEERMVPFRPVRPMLARTAEGPADALDRLGRAAFEVKLDGARVQVHRVDDTVRVFTRSLRDETAALPELVEAVRALPVRDVVLDGEAIALEPDGAPRPFQETMRRFGRKRDLPGARDTVPLTPFFFDLLYLDGEPWIDRSAVERWEALARVVPPALRPEHLVTDDVEVAERMLASARARGHEGLVVKALDAPYLAGRRGAGWLKVKPCFTADLVVLAAEWGHGRRSGWLSNLHLGARGEAPGEWVMVGKTFKGMTDATLAWQTERLLALADGEGRHVVNVRPELVVEVAFDGVQSSPRYAGGLALRFARVRGYRTDKTPEEADTAAWLRELKDRRS